MELYLGLRRRGFMRVATISTCWLPRRQHAIGLITGQARSGDRNGAGRDIAIPLHQCDDRRPDRFPRKRLQPEGPDQASANGFQIEAGVQVPAGTGAVRLSAGLWPDGKSRREIRCTALQIPTIWLTGNIPDLPTPFDETARVDLTAFAGFANGRSRPASRRSSSARLPANSTLTPAEHDAHHSHRSRNRPWPRSRDRGRRIEFDRPGRRTGAARRSWPAPTRCCRSCPTITSRCRPASRRTFGRSPIRRRCPSSCMTFLRERSANWPTTRW